MAITDRMMVKCDLSKFTGERARCRWCNSTLTGRQKRWCSKACADTAASQHWFSWARMYVRNRDGRKCVKCGSRGSIEINHIKPAQGSHSKADCRHHHSNLEAVCKPCHAAITREQRRVKSEG